ncbi:FLRT1 protein, partial [Atlantisia rogersi]|nr:FLRT1 protein [Atlantisia rogersi]
LAWLRDWLRRRAPRRLEVRGLLCQAPARLRGLAVGDLRGEMDACDAPPAHGAVTAAPGDGGGGVAAAAPGVMAAASPNGASTTVTTTTTTTTTGGGLWVQALPGGSLRVRWPPAPPGASLRLSWLRPGGGGVTETLVRGERG